MTAVVSPVAYCISVGLAALVCGTLCVAVRRRPGPWSIVAARLIGLVLAADVLSWTIRLVVRGEWSAATSLPLALCNMAVPVAAAACWWRVPLLVELTWFWGLAGTLQAVVTPDLGEEFPHLVFFQYVVGHLGIVVAALFLVAGLQITPRRGAVRRTFLVSAGYTAFVGVVDALSGANYMFLRRPPSNWTLLRLLGPWPWYIASSAGLALVLFVLLDAPFWRGRRDPSLSGRRRPGRAVPTPA